jgi:Tol biopolymer transport system component
MNSSIIIFLVFLLPFENVMINHGNGQGQSSQNGTSIVFQTERHGPNEEIYIMNADGSNPVRLTFNNSRDVCPCISPDGQRIAFSSTRNGNEEIYVMNRDGSNQQRLTTSPGLDCHPDWSPDGSQIAFLSERDGNYEIYVMDSDGSNQTRITFNTWQDQLPDWSPDGTKILFSSNPSGTHGIYIMNANGSGIQPVNDGPLQEIMGRWSPDGTKIVFVKMISFSQQRDVWLMDSDGGNEQQLTVNPAIDEDACWSPDGTMIVFQSDRNGLYQLFTMNPDGSNQTLIPGSQGDYWPSWGIDPSATATPDNEHFILGIYLYQNVPNPFSGRTLIEFGIPETLPIVLELVDQNGIVKAVLANEILPAGNYMTELTAENLPSGVYYYMLKAGKTCLVRKMILY